MCSPQNTLDAIIRAAERLDPVLVNEFLTSSLDSAQTHYEMIRSTLTEGQRIHHERLICNGYILLHLLISATTSPAGKV